MTRNLRHMFALSCALLAAPIVQAQSLDSEQSAFLTLINNYRAQNGAGPLQISVALQNASQWMSGDMAAKGYFSHTDSLGRDPFRRMADFGYSYAPAGENIAAGNASAQSTFNQWQASSGHQANMLNAGYKVIGIGRVYNSASPYRWYWTTNFGGVVDGGGGIPNPPTARPIISFFAASPSIVAPGQATILSWNVSGATSVSIDNGVGDVSGVTSKSVVPTQTTTYRLTASNAGGATTAMATATVNAPASDTQPPSAPATLWASAAAATRVNLQWTASTDNVGVTGYQILRNGSVLTVVPGSATTYTDNSVIGSSTYSYLVRAYDAAGNYSGFSRSAQVTTPPSYTPVTPASITAVSGSSQSAVVASAFVSPLRVRVLGASSQPVAGVTVTFTAPASGPSAMFSGSGAISTAVTDASGLASSPALIANGIAGNYSISASVSGLAPIPFPLTNTSAATPPPSSGAISIWANSFTPPNRYMTYGNAIELGVKFRSDVSGKITGVRFYKNAGNGGVHKGSLWAADGRLLATGTFTNETASGWQTLTFSSPVTIAANTTYVASYHTNSGVFAVALGYFRTQSGDNGTLHALRSGVDGPNGVLFPGAGGRFPSYGSMGDNYWVDVVFVK